MVYCTVPKAFGRKGSSREEANKTGRWTKSTVLFIAAIGCYRLVPVKFCPDTFAPFMLSVILVGLNVYLFLLGVIVYEPFGSPVKM
jgi:hypothetical protein